MSWLLCEEVKAGTGNITIHKSSDDSIVETIDVKSSQVTGNGSKELTVNPNIILEDNFSYYFKIDSKAIQNIYGDYYDNQRFEKLFPFSTADENPPKLISFATPGLGSKDIKTANRFVFKFDQVVNIQKDLFL